MPLVLKGGFMFSSLWKKMLLAATFAVSMTSANALNIDFGNLSAPASASNIAVSGSFDDIFSFTATTSGALGSIVGLDIVGNLEAQYRFGVGATPTWSNFSSLASVPSDDDGVFSFSQTVNGLQAGQKYWFEVKGSGTQAKYTVSLAPVPEPETYAMLLAGLGAVGVMVRRRKSSVQA